jgi:single-stranded-DNA-specific exonuclease
MDAIGFSLGDQIEGTGPRARLAYRLDVNSYRGVKSPQLIVEHLEWTS